MTTVNVREASILLAAALMVLKFLHFVDVFVTLSKKFSCLTLSLCTTVVWPWKIHFSISKSRDVSLLSVEKINQTIK